jgi:hypothetical protein
MVYDDRFDFLKIQLPSVWLSFYKGSGGSFKGRDGKMKLPPTSSLAQKFPDKVASAAEMKEREAKLAGKGASPGAKLTDLNSIKFDEPEANKKAGEAYNAAKEAIDKKYGKLSFRNPADREAINKRREELGKLEEDYSNWLKNYGRATSSEWNPVQPTEAELKRMKSAMNLFKTQQEYEANLRRGKK